MSRGKEKGTECVGSPKTQHPGHMGDDAPEHSGICCFLSLVCGPLENNALPLIRRSKGLGRFL